MLVATLHAFDKTAHTGLTELSVPPKMLLPPYARLFGRTVVAGVWRAEQGAAFVDLHPPALVNEVDDRVGFPNVPTASL